MVWCGSMVRAEWALARQQATRDTTCSKVSDEGRGWNAQSATVHWQWRGSVVAGGWRAGAGRGERARRRCCKGWRAIEVRCRSLIMSVK